jgi:hypothetical protein
MMLYFNIFNPLEENHWSEYNNATAKQSKLVSIYDSCKNMVKDRVDSERSYTEAIMQQK